MQLKCKKSKLKDGNTFVSSRSELAAVLAVAESVAKLAPQGVTLSDEVVFGTNGLKLEWIHSRDGKKVEVKQMRRLEKDISEGLTYCQSRRVDAIRDNRAIHELPTDAKLLALNKSLNEAKGMDCSLHLSEDSESDPLPTFDPRDLLLQVPRAEPQVVKANFLVSGSNVVGGTVQLELLGETRVDVVYFLQGAHYQQIRASVPLRLTNVRNLITHIRVRCTLLRPGDSFLTAMDVPTLYEIVDGKEVPH